MIDSPEQERSGIGQISDGVCPICMKKETELMMYEIAYPGHFRRLKMCLDCKDMLCFALGKTLESIRIY